MSTCKHCEMESHDCDYCCDGSHVDLLEKRVKELEEFIKGIAKHDFGLSDMCPHKVHEAARNILGWPIEEEEEES